MQEGQFSEVDELGKRLSLEISCPVRLGTKGGKGTFVCDCGLTFPVDLLKQGDWEEVKRKHKEESRGLSIAD